MLTRQKELVIRRIFAVPVDNRVKKKETEKTNTWILRESWKTIQHEGDSDASNS